MPPVQSAESGTYRPFTKLVGAEPLPGYKLLEPLGRGGFGEVWKCEAPGGLHKAIKFVSGAECRRRPRRATAPPGARRVSADQVDPPPVPSHPRTRRDRRATNSSWSWNWPTGNFRTGSASAGACGLPGIPRDELLAYFADAAEALDVIAAKYDLQHLDVKPANLFLVAGHVKVGDYGLVAKLEPDPSKGDHRGLTPKYVAPEVLRGQPCTRSDQYSLALVYQELLTGTFPYDGKTPQQLMMHHIATKPRARRSAAGRPADRRAGAGEEAGRARSRRAWRSCRR